MSSYITEWNSLDVVGHKGKGMGGPNHDHRHNAGRLALRYASIIGTAFTIGLAIYNCAMVMM